MYKSKSNSTLFGNGNGPHANAGTAANGTAFAVESAPMNPVARDMMLARMDREASEILWKSVAEECKRMLAEAHPLVAANDPRGQYTMAKCLRHGWGVGTDRKQSLILYKKAANQGHAGACYELARLYCKGDSKMGVDKDLDMADMFVDKGLVADKGETYDTRDYKQAEAMESLRLFKTVIQINRNLARKDEEERVSRQYSASM